MPAGDAPAGLLRSALAALARRPETLSADRASLGGLSKFVDGAVAVPMGEARGPSPLLSLAVRLAAVGAVSAFSIAFSDAKAQSRDHGFGGRHRQPGLAQQVQVPQRPQFGQGGGWNRPTPRYDGGNAGYGNAIQAWRDRREYRREERNTALLATGAVIAGAIIGNQALGRNYGGGYGAQYGGGYGAYGAYPPPDAYRPAQVPAYGGYGGGYGAPPGYGGYAPRPIVPSDEFVVDAKKIIAAKLRDNQAAERIIDDAVYQGVACVRQMGPGASCTARTHEVTLDFVRGVFTASIKGIPVVEEVNGQLTRLRPDILNDAHRRAMGAHIDSLGGGYGGRRPGM